MAQLNVTADKIQLTTNMITSANAADWESDTKYPSAKAVTNKINEITIGALEHPINSVIMIQKDLAVGETAASTNPATTLGGEWTLVDKGFRAGVSNLARQDGGSNTNFKVSVETVRRDGHTLSIYIRLFAINDTTISMASPTKIIIEPLSSYGVHGLSYRIDDAIAFSKRANESSVICYSLATNGELFLNAALGASNTNIPRDSEICIHATMNILSHYSMIDSFCDKFYWKRTA